MSIKQKTGKRYELIVPFEGVYFDVTRQQYSGELKKYVNTEFGEALTEADATLTISVLDDDIDDGCEIETLEINSVFMDAEQAKDAGTEETLVDIEVYMTAANFKVSPEKIWEWAKENGWDIYDWSGPDLEEEERS